MTTVRVTSGVLEVQAGNLGSIDNTLPGLQPGIDNTLPVPPPGIWPPPSLAHPIVPLPPNHPMPPGSIWPPIYPPDPGYGQGRPRPPGYVSGQPLPGGEVDNELPEGPQGPVHPRQPRFLVAIVGASTHGGGLQVIGWTVVDPSLSVGLPLPGGRPPGYVSGQPVPGGEIDNTLPTPEQPK